MIDQWFYSRADWRPAWSLIPRRCDISNRWIWGQHMHGTNWISGPGEPVIIDIWNHRDEHLIQRLKGNIK